MQDQDDEKMPSYEAVGHACEALGVERSVSETHGLLSAFLAMHVKIQPAAWLDTLRGGEKHHSGEEVSAAEDVLFQVFSGTQSQLDSSEYAFALLLPTDDAAFETRVTAFAEWTQGFVAGLHLMNVNLQGGYSPDVDEALEDLVKFSCLVTEADEPGSEADEAAYMELVEYARVAVMLLHSQASLLVPGSNERH